MAEGKALQAATGVTPVFVTNWPGTGVPVPGVVGGAAGATASTAIGTAAAVGSIPAIGTAVVGAGSIAIGKFAAGLTASMMTVEQLQSLRSRQMVMGGGTNSFQVEFIDREIARRDGGRWQSALNPKIDFMSQQPMNQINNRADTQIKVDVHFDELARAFTNVNSTKTNVSVDNSSRGDFFNAIATTQAM